MTTILPDMVTDAGRILTRTDSFFADPESGEPFARDELVDRRGQDLVGSDDHGIWWGTEHAVWVLGLGHCPIRVVGFLGAEPWEGWFAGTEEMAIAYARARRVRVTSVDDLPI